MCTIPTRFSAAAVAVAAVMLCRCLLRLAIASHPRPILVLRSSHEDGEGRTETLYADPQAEMDPEALALPLFPKLPDWGETRDPSHLFFAFCGEERAYRHDI